MREHRFYRVQVFIALTEAAQSRRLKGRAAVAVLFAEIYKMIKSVFIGLTIELARQSQFATKEGAAHDQIPL